MKNKEIKKFELPRIEEIFIPILKILKKERTFRLIDLVKEVRDKHYSNLPIELKTQKYEVTKVNILFDRINWAITHLYMGKFIARMERAVYKITPKGLKILKLGILNLTTLKQDSDYQNYLKQKNNKKNNSNESLLGDSFPTGSIEEKVQEILSKQKNDLLNDLLNKLKVMNFYLLEEKVLELFTRMGYGEFKTTKKSRDSGIDGIINSDELGLEKIYVQVKRWNNGKIREIDMRNFIGAMSGETDKGIFITTSDFDKKTKEKVEKDNHKIKLINGKKLVDLMYKYNLGFKIKNTYEIKEIDESFFDESN